MRRPEPESADAGLRRVVPEAGDAQMMDLWVLSHPDLRRAARIRAVTEFIGDTIAAERDLFEGRRPCERDCSSPA